MAEGRGSNKDSGVVLVGMEGHGPKGHLSTRSGQEQEVDRPWSKPLRCGVTPSSCSSLGSPRVPSQEVHKQWLSVQLERMLKKGFLGEDHTLKITAHTYPCTHTSRLKSIVCLII